MTLFQSTADLVATGIVWTAGTALLVAPVLFLTAPTLTDSGTSRVGIELARDGYRRLVPRSYPAEGYPEAAEA